MRQVQGWALYHNVFSKDVVGEFVGATGAVDEREVVCGFHFDVAVGLEDLLVEVNGEVGEADLWEVSGESAVSCKLVVGSCELL